MQLYFIRHGQSINNAHWGEVGFQDHSDPELTEKGHQQARLLARFLGDRQNFTGVEFNSQNEHGFGFTHIYTSLMVRAVSTATALAEAIGLPLVAWPEIHEGGGIFTRDDGDERMGLPGKTRSYFEEHFPDLILPDWLDERGWWQSRPHEKREELTLRAAKVWNELLTQHGDQPGQTEQRVAFVSHGGFFMFLLTSALGVEMRLINEGLDEYWFLMNNCAITRLDVGVQVQVSYTNRTDFLPPYLIT